MTSTNNDSPRTSSAKGGPTARQPSPNSPLLMLPAELRLQIYPHLLYSDEVPLTANHHLYIWPDNTSEIQISLTRICRVIRAEVLPEIYARVTFSFTCAPPTIRFPSRRIRRIGRPENCAFGDLVQNATFKVLAEDEDRAAESIVTLGRVFKGLDGCRGLRSLHIELGLWSLVDEVSEQLLDLVRSLSLQKTCEVSVHNCVPENRENRVLCDKVERALQRQVVYLICTRSDWLTL